MCGERSAREPRSTSSSVKHSTGRAVAVSGIDLLIFIDDGTSDSSRMNLGVFAD